MAILDDLALAVAKSAEWKKPEPQKDGAYHFRLQDDLDFALFTPDGRLGLVVGNVATLPDEGIDREDMLAESARRQVGICRTRPSILAFERAGQGMIQLDDEKKDRLILFRRLRLESDAVIESVRQVRDFLNDLQWWRKTTSPEFSGGASPFSMAGAKNFWVGGLLY